VKQQREKSELQRTQSEAVKKLDIPEKINAVDLPSLHQSSVTTRKKQKKSNIIVTTARGDTSTPEKAKKNRIAKKAQSPGTSPVPLHETGNTNSAASRRQRSVSMSPNNHARPVMDFENVKQNKVTPKPHKKRAQTPQKVRRPVLTEAVFKPPSDNGSAEGGASPELEHTSEVESNMTLISENISSKPLEQIAEEVVKVLNAQGLNYRKRKNKCIWKCSKQINSETVTLQIEIIQVPNNNFGVIIRRIEGNFHGYQVLYNLLKKDITL